MSADNFLFVRLNGTVEERSDSHPELAGPVIHAGENQAVAEIWAEEEIDRRDERYEPVEYGVILETQKENESFS